tara:strand:- start:6831 stop:7295 length:465 start_codon:yes stop_codon:yes gene_type:complete
LKNTKQNYFKKIGKSLPKIITKDIKKKNFIQFSLLNNWKSIIGEEISRFCKPEKVVFSHNENINGTIYLKTIRGKSLEIEFKSEEIIEKLNQYFGYKAINKISVIQEFNVIRKKESNKKRLDKKIKKNQIKAINKIKKIDLKNALKSLNKTLFK